MYGIFYNQSLGKKMMIHKCEFSLRSPYANVQGGRMRIPMHVLVKGGILGHLSRLGEDFPEKNRKRGCFKPIPQIWVFFRSFPRNQEKKGYDLYVHVSRAFNSFQRKRALISLLIGDRPPRGYCKIRTHISRARGKEKKRKERE